MAKKSIRGKLKTKKRDPILYYYYMENCMFCQEFNSDWECIAEDLKESFKCKKINSRAEKHTKREKKILDEHVNTVPCIVLFNPDNKETFIFAGERDVEKIEAWSKMHSKDRESTRFKIFEKQKIEDLDTNTDILTSPPSRKTKPGKKPSKKTKK